MSKVKIVLEFDTECTTNGGTYIIYKDDIQVTNEFNLTREEYIKLNGLVNYVHSLTHMCASAQKVSILGEHPDLKDVH